MGKILDLSVFDEETLDVKLGGGRMIHLKKPTQGLVIAMLRLRHMDESTPEEAALAAMNSIALKILNNNADGIEFTLASVEALTLDVKSHLLSGYSEFAAELQANPTFSSPQSPDPKMETPRRSCFAAFMRRLSMRD